MILNKDGEELFEYTYDDSFPERIRIQYLDVEDERFYFSEYFGSNRESEEVYAYFESKRNNVG